MSISNAWNRVVKTKTCWLWSGKLDRYGYGRVGYVDGGRKRIMQATRAIWLLSGRQLDCHHALHHKCNNKHCVNPEHLEPILWEDHSSLHNPQNTHCVHGHELTPENVTHNRQGHRSGCRECKRIRDRRNWYRKNGTG